MSTPPKSEKMTLKEHYTHIYLCKNADHPSGPSKLNLIPFSVSLSWRCWCSVHAAKPAVLNLTLRVFTQFLQGCANSLHVEVTLSVLDKCCYSCPVTYFLFLLDNSDFRGSDIRPSLRQCEAPKRHSQPYCANIEEGRKNINLNCGRLFIRPTWSLGSFWPTLPAFF